MRKTGTPSLLIVIHLVLFNNMPKSETFVKMR